MGGTTIKDRVLRCLEGGVERTAHEIGDILALSSRTVSARLAELRHSGSIEAAGRGNRKSVTARGPNPTVWRIKTGEAGK